MPIPRGYYVGARGWLKPDPDDDNGRKSKKNGNKNGNGHSGANGTSTGNGNGNGNGSNGGGGMSSEAFEIDKTAHKACLLYTSPSPRDRQKSRMPSSA